MLFRSEDDPADVRLAQALVRQAGAEAEWSHAVRLADVDFSGAGQWADCALVDLEVSPVVEEGELLDRHRLSPYVGRELRGRIRRTLLRGRTIFQDGATVGGPAGRFVKPEGRPWRES